MSSPIVVKQKSESRDLKSEISSATKSSIQSCEEIRLSDSWFSKRKLPNDTAGFAVNVYFLATKPNHYMPYKKL